MADSTPAIDKVLKWEGKDIFTDDPDDPGGPTKSGCTEVEARAEGYKGDMKDMPLEIAIAVFKKKFWDPLCLDQVMDQDIAAQIMQAAVNQGLGRWKLYIQQACNFLMPGYEKLLSVDGSIGPKTLNAINTIAKSNRTGLSKRIYDIQQKRYDEVQINNPVLKKYRQGWDNRAKDFLITA